MIKADDNHRAVLALLSGGQRGGDFAYLLGTLIGGGESCLHARISHQPLVQALATAVGHGESWSGLVSPPLIDAFAQTVSSWRTGELQVSESQSGAFLAGLLNGGAVVSLQPQGLQIRFFCPSSELGVYLEALFGQGHGGDGQDLLYSDEAALDLLGRAYEQEDCEAWGSPEQRQLYSAACNTFAASAVTVPLQLRVKRLSTAAVLPKKQRVSDSGYDLTVLNLKKRVGRVELYGTGLAVAPPWGWYFDVVPRSSIIKLGYILANSVGIIDRAYRGELLIPLLKVDPDLPDLELPGRVAQLIPRPIIHMQVAEFAELTDTHRKTSGFGSSGHR